MTPIKRCDFEFVRAHVHADTEYKRGATARLPESEAEKLQRAGAGRIVRPQSLRPKPKRK